MSKAVTWYVSSDLQVYVLGLRRDLPVSSIARAGTTVTVTAPSHGLSAGAVVRVGGCEQQDYNGDQTVATVPDADTFTYELAAALAPTTPATPDHTGRLRCGAYLADATVAGVLRDADGATVTGADAIAFAYLSGSNGEYVGQLPATLPLSADATYTLTITATAATGEVLTLSQSGKATGYAA